MPDDFQSIDDIEKHFGKLRKAAEKEGDEAKVREIALDEKEAKADFRDRQSAARELESVRREAISKAGLPEHLHRYVVGATAEEVTASVEQVVKDFAVQASALQQEQQERERMYAAPGVGGGQGAAPGPRLGERSKRMQETTNKINRDIAKRSAYRASRMDGRPGQIPEVDAAELAQYAADNLGRQITAGLIRNSQHPVIGALDASKID